MSISILNKHHGHRGNGTTKFYIGRGSPLGNPYPIDSNNTREQVIAKYKIWLEHHIEINDPEICNELNAILIASKHYDVGLICFCTPKKCHGEVIKEIILDRISKL